MPKLLVDGVSRTFPPVRGGVPTRALEPTHLSVEDNDFVTILGPSGCGKSTLLRIVAGLDRPTEGRVLLDGKPVREPGPDRGMVFQSYTLFPWLTVRENICFGLREKGTPEAEQRGIADFFINRTGLKGFENHFRKHALGRDAAAHRPRPRARQRPEILLLDEPFGALDNQTRALMQELLLGIWEADAQDGPVRHARHRGGDLPGEPRRRHDRPARPHKIRDRSRPAASARLHDEDDAGVRPHESRAHRSHPRGSDQSRRGARGKMRRARSPSPACGGRSGWGKPPVEPGSPATGRAFPHFNPPPQAGEGIWKFCALLLALLLAASAAAATERETAEFNGIERSWRIERPATPGPHPLLVALHGIGDDIDNFAKATKLGESGLARGFAVVFPEGSGERRGWNAGFCCGTALRQDIDDVGFILELVERIDGIDPNRVFLAGMSNGAMLAYRIAAEQPERIAGMVAVAGAIGGTGRDGTPAYSIPLPRFAVPVMIVHGRADPFVLHEGGVSAVLGIPGRHNASVEEAIDFWTRVNDCAHRVIIRDRMKPTLTLSRGRQCAATVVAWSLDGFGHAWPAEIDGRPFTQMVVDFFAELPPRAR